MATFTKGDWVEVTPQRDLKWDGWTAIHDEYCGKIGYIESIWTDSMGVEYYNVTVNFPNGILKSKPGDYYAEFLSHHIIPSSKYELDLRKHRQKKCDELQEWEETKRRKTDEALRRVFTTEENNTLPKDLDYNLVYDDAPAPNDDVWNLDVWNEKTKDYTITQPPLFCDDDIEDLLDNYVNGDLDD